MNSAKHIDNGYALRPSGLGSGRCVQGGFDRTIEARRELPALQD